MDILGLSSAMPPINRVVKCYEELFNGCHRSHADGIERKRAVANYLDTSMRIWGFKELFF